MFSNFSFFKKQASPEKNIREVVVPLLGTGLELDDVKVSPDGQAIIVLVVTEDSADLPQRKSRIENALAGIKGISKTMVVLTGQSRPTHLQQEDPRKPSGRPAPNTEKITGLPPVIIAVASGKGGVGKSTVAVNLAMGLSRAGKKVGILDADIYGPSLPRLLGVVEKRVEAAEDKRLQPIDVQGLKAMSMGFMVDEAAPMIWRGPMVQSALIQMCRDVNWDGLDILVIDLPPGTGDIHLTLAQRVPVTGGIVVSTPQDIALVDARKGFEMFRKVGVPVLGIVENMAYYCCPNCGNKDDIFGTGGAEAEAVKTGVPFLGRIPLHRSIRALSDAGTPVVAASPDSPEARAFTEVIGKMGL